MLSSLAWSVVLSTIDIINYGSQAGCSHWTHSLLSSYMYTGARITSDGKVIGLATLHSKRNTSRQPNYNSPVFWKYGFRLRYTSVRKGHTVNNEWLPKVCLQSRNTANFRNGAAHKSGIQSNNWTSTYIRVTKRNLQKTMKSTEVLNPRRRSINTESQDIAK